MLDLKEMVLSLVKSPCGLVKVFYRQTAKSGSMWEDMRVAGRKKVTQEEDKTRL